ISSSALPGTAGFITFPGGMFKLDPTSNPTLPGYGDSSFVNGYTYDLNRSRWLPTTRTAVAADGSAYTYWDGTFHVFNLDAGADSPLATPPGWDHLMEPPTIFELAPEGVYVSSGTRGLWLLSSQGEHQVTADAYWDAVANGAAWGRPTNAYSGPSAVYSILRLDLKTGVAESWFTQVGVRQVVGVDVHGDPIVMVTPDSTGFELWIVTARDHGTRIYSTTSGGLETPVIGDSHGIWFESSPWLYLYSPDTGARQMAPDRSGLAGACG
ncbi:MAG TPA: hypothetical protein VHO95_09165, partial [Candidatus Dormibacteraeota bacterium]|nr:hypothetical protein [Candidatus Dormibacteraeota bacterium]